MWSPWDGSSFRRHTNFCTDYAPVLKKKKSNELNAKNEQWQINNNNQILSSSQSLTTQNSISFASGVQFNSRNFVQNPAIFQRPSSICTVSNKVMRMPFNSNYRPANATFSRTVYTAHGNPLTEFTLKPNTRSIAPLNDLQEPLFDSTSLIGIKFKNYNFLINILLLHLTK